jgi:hypothetical protein
MVFPTGTEVHFARIVVVGGTSSEISATASDGGFTVVSAVSAANGTSDPASTFAVSNPGSKLSTVGVELSVAAPVSDEVVVVRVVVESKGLESVAEVTKESTGDVESCPRESVADESTAGEIGLDPQADVINKASSAGTPIIECL